MICVHLDVGVIEKYSQRLLVIFAIGSRGRNTRYRVLPAQTRTCSFPASGSSVVLAFATGACSYKDRTLPLPLHYAWFRHTQFLQGCLER